MVRNHPRCRPYAKLSVLRCAAHLSQRRHVADLAVYGATTPQSQPTSDTARPTRRRREASGCAAARWETCSAHGTPPSSHLPRHPAGAQTADCLDVIACWMLDAGLQLEKQPLPLWVSLWRSLNNSLLGNGSCDTLMHQSADGVSGRAPHDPVTCPARPRTTPCARAASACGRSAPTAAKLAAAAAAARALSARRAGLRRHCG